MTADGKSGGSGSGGGGPRLAVPARTSIKFRWPTHEQVRSGWLALLTHNTSPLLHSLTPLKALVEVIVEYLISPSDAHLTTRASIDLFTPSTSTARRQLLATPLPPYDLGDADTPLIRGAISFQRPVHGRHAPVVRHRSGVLYMRCLEWSNMSLRDFDDAGTRRRSGTGNGSGSGKGGGGFVFGDDEEGEEEEANDEEEEEEPVIGRIRLDDFLEMHMRGGRHHQILISFRADAATGSGGTGSGVAGGTRVIGLGTKSKEDQTVLYGAAYHDNHCVALPDRDLMGCCCLLRLVVVRSNRTE